VHVDDDDDRVVPARAGERCVEMLRIDEDRVVVAPVHTEVPQLPESRMPAADLVELPQVGREGVARGLCRRPVAELVLVLLVVDVLLGTGTRDVLVEFVAGVHAVKRSSGRGDRSTDPVCGAAAELQVFGEDVRGVDEQIGPEVVRRLLGDGDEELLQLRLGVPPGEVAVALLESDRRQSAERGGAGERLGEEDHVRVRIVHGPDEPFPEPQGFGVRVVHAEDAHALGDPVLDDAQNLRREAGEIAVEVEGIDVLVLLRRVLRVGDRAVREGREPLRMRGDPWVVGRGLQGEVECD
ncbi:hypothetical protein ABE10_00625, partial [Bacillus toyonensis]|nr:hypothetical protein [Bacillus toyonensis]